MAPQADWEHADVSDFDLSITVRVTGTDEHWEASVREVIETYRHRPTGPEYNADRITYQPHPTPSLSIRVENPQEIPDLQQSANQIVQRAADIAGRQKEIAQQAEQLAQDEASRRAEQAEEIRRQLRGD